MDNSGLTCPLCCGEKFSSRASLRDHLTEIAHCVRCPSCQGTFNTISDLVIHLESESCGISSEIEKLETAVIQSYTAQNQDHSTYANDEKLNIVKLESAPPQELTFVTTNADQNLNVVSQSDGHILIVNDESDLLSNRNIITTQNEDGTISFTQVGAEEMSDCEAEDNLLEGGTEEANGDGDLYSCNTCGVSFTSVVDHIHNYHSEQDVVVEVADSDTELMNAQGLQNDLAESKRIIAATGRYMTQEQYDKMEVQKDEDDNLNITEGENQDENAAISYKQKLVKIKKFWENSEIGLGNMDEITESLQFENGQAKVYGCSKCHIKSTSIQVMEKHVCRQNYIKQSGIYSCVQCSCSFNNPKSLCAHMKAHKKRLDDPGATKKLQLTKPLQKNVFKCHTCGTVFTTNKSLRLHKRMHDPIKSRPMEAPVSYLSLDKTEDTFHCELCNKWIHVGYRDIHEEYHHGGAAQHHCEICNRKFVSEDCLLMHMNIHNSKRSPVKAEKGELPYPCMFCDRKFARPHEKVKHERIHTGEKPHVCEICGKAFRVSYCLTLHMRTHTGERPYECPHCLKRFKAHSVYNHHLLTHSEKRAYKCPYCPKAFKTLVQLAGHKNAHTKPFSCKECNRPFASLYAVRVHTETHRKINNLKYACRLCGATYARAFALKDHMTSIHGELEIKRDEMEDLCTTTESNMITM